MPAIKPISREYRIYLALWRKALLSPKEIISVKTPSLSMAVAMRQGMYRAIRPFRLGLSSDTQLTQAAEKYVVFLEKASDKIDPHWLIFKERMTLAALENVWNSLGIDEEDLLLGDERSMSDSLKALIQKDAEPVVLPAATPFYQREG